ncbi:hypothetical protein MSAN_01914000 [Mycena sanguinolenta]|uniref:Uncharacterized protein n=1 Tax=Mycena sanguinolenta TaxID=230812 RepID=A0A8H6XPY0_9AGAR|nr:hypothetical protein MSAN_01914000 [Mycena sanguinolenta]
MNYTLQQGRGIKGRASDSLTPVYSTAMFNSKALFALVALVSFASSSTTPAGKPSTDASASVEVCTGAGNPPNGCVTIAVVSDNCVNLTGRLSFLNKDITIAVVPAGFICTFFEDFRCISSGTGNSGTDSEVVLQGGTWDLSKAPGLSGTENFNDLTSSLSCSPL